MKIFSILISGLNDPASAAIYTDVNERIDKLVPIFMFISVDLTLPPVFLPNFIKSYYLYFFTDSGADAFELPFPNWLVIFLVISVFHLKTCKFLFIS